MTKSDKNFRTVYSFQEIKLLKKLDSSNKIQDYLNSLKFNFEKRGDTCYSPRFVIKNKTAHCMEGAMFAATALEFHGMKPLVMDLRAVEHDFDHVIALFKKDGCWGAISKTNHAVLRYREPIYKTLRELTLSYFHEYFDDKGRKNLREYSKPFDLRYFDRYPIKLPPQDLGRAGERSTRVNWRTSDKNLFAIPEHLDKIKHYKILNKQQIKNLRKADKIEILAGKIVEYKK